MSETETTQPVPPVASALSNTLSSPLLQALGSMGMGAASEPHDCFAERLSRLFDLSGSIALDDALAQQHSGPFSESLRQAQRALADLQRAQKALARHIHDSFSDADSFSSIRLPDPEQMKANAYQQFYLAHQQRMATGVQQLRARARTLLNEQSPELATLASLDGVFENAISAYARQCFAALPIIAQQRLTLLQQETAAAGPQAWQAPFLQELQFLLLAELHTRQEPLQGLINAFAAHIHRVQEQRHSTDTSLTTQQELTA